MLGSLPPEVIDIILAEIASSWEDSPTARQTLYNYSSTSRENRSIAARYIFSNVSITPPKSYSRDAFTKSIARFKAFVDILDNNPSVSSSVRKLRIDLEPSNPLVSLSRNSSNKAPPLLSYYLSNILSRLHNVREFIFNNRGPEMPWTSLSQEASNSVLSLIASLKKLHIIGFNAFPAWALLSCQKLKEISLQKCVEGATLSTVHRSKLVPPADIEVSTSLTVLKTFGSPSVVGYLAIHHPSIFSALKAFETYVHSHEEISISSMILGRAALLETLKIRTLRDDIYTETAPALFDLGGLPSLRKLEVEAYVEEVQKFPMALLTLLRPRGPNKHTFEILDIYIEWEVLTHSDEQSRLQPHVEWSTLDDILSNEKYSDLKEIHFKLAFQMSYRSRDYDRIQAELHGCAALLLPKVRASGKKLEVEILCKRW